MKSKLSLCQPCKKDSNPMAKTKQQIEREKKQRLRKIPVTKNPSILEE